MKVIIGIKKEMTQIFTDDGTVVPITLVDVNGVFVSGTRTKERDGYTAVVLAQGKKASASKAETGKYKALGFVPEVEVESRAEEVSAQPGEQLKASVFAAHDKVNVTGITKSKGFQGVVKRWGFAGGPHTHGQSDRERHPGSIGNRTTPGRVYKGKKMAGRMGGTTKTVKNLEIVLIDEENGLLGIKGSLPGNRGSIVIIRAKA